MAWLNCALFGLIALYSAVGLACILATTGLIRGAR